MLTQQITIDHTQVGGSDLTNFTMRFGVSDGSQSYLATVANGGDVINASGFDITFTSDAGGSSLLNFARVFWDPVTGNSKFYVMVPAVSASIDTIIYLQYGFVTAIDHQNAPATWDSNYKSAQNFPDGTTLSAADSTAQNTFTNHGATAAAGLNDGAASFNGTTQFIDTPAGATNITGTLTVEAWVNNSIDTGGSMPICANFPSGKTGGYLCYINGSDARKQPGLLTVSGGGFSGVFVASAHITGSGWVYLLFKVNTGVAHSILVNGVFPGWDAESGSGVIGDSPSQAVGVGKDSAGEFYGGLINELWVSDNYRTDGYAIARFNNGRAGSTFFSLAPISTINGEINQSVLEMMVTAFPPVDVNQSVLEFAIIPFIPPPPPPVPGGAGVAVNGGLPAGVAQHLGSCRPANSYDQCMFALEAAWRATRFPSRYKPCLGIDTSEIPWAYDWGALPVGAESFYQSGSIITPAPADGDQVVATLKIPSGYDGILTGIYQVYTGQGFAQGSGDIVWRIKENLHYLSNLGNVPYAYGTPALPAPLTEGELLLSDQVLRYIVNVPNTSGAITPGQDRITCGFIGYWWPRGGVFKQLPRTTSTYVSKPL